MQTHQKTDQWEAPGRPAADTQFERTAVRGFVVTSFLLGLAAFVPVLMAWFSSEELVLFAIMKVDLFAIWFGRDHLPGFFRPVIPLLAWAWAQIFGINATAFHALSVMLHLANAVLVWKVAGLWARHHPGAAALLRPQVAVACGALFWLWPSHSEPVGWIPGLTDVAAATPLLVSLYGYLHYRNANARPWLWAALAAYAVALCTKEAAITLPGVIAVYEIMRACNDRRISARNVIGPATYGAVMVAYLLFRRWWMGAFLGGYGAGVHSDFSFARLHEVLAPNLANAFFPVPGLSPRWSGLAMVAFFLLGAAALIFAARRGRAVGPAIAAAAGAVVLFLPGLNLSTGYITEGQRFAYVPSALAVVAVVYTLALVVRGGRKFLALAMVLGAACAVCLGMYNYNWYRAGRAAEKIVAGMTDLPRARKIFVLATTDNYNEAFIMPHSLALAGMALLDDPPTKEMPVAVAVNYWRSDYKVRAAAASREGNPGWLVSLQPRTDAAAAKAAAQPLTAPNLQPLFPAPADWEEIRPEANGVFVRPAGFDPSLDKIVYLDGTKWHVL